MGTGEIKISLVTGNWHAGRWLVISKLNEGGVVQKKRRGFMKRYENWKDDRVLVHQMCWYYKLELQHFEFFRLQKIIKKTDQKFLKIHNFGLKA